MKRSLWPKCDLNGDRREGWETSQEAVELVPERWSQVGLDGAGVGLSSGLSQKLPQHFKN